MKRKTAFKSFIIQVMMLVALFLFAQQLRAQNTGCTVQFSYQMTPATMNVYFVASQSNLPATYSWDFGDGSVPASGANPQHLYPHSGTYYVCLNASYVTPAGAACTAHWCDSVHVGTTIASCNAQFTWSAAMNTLTGIAFTSAANPAGTSYLWNFGDGTTSNQVNPSHVYAAPGPYYVCLTVSGNGCTNSWCDSVHVVNTQTNCDAHFSAVATSATGGIYFNPVMNTMATTYSWDFGDGATDTLRTPVHQYTNPGAYLACLTVTRYTTAGTVACTAHYCDSVHVVSPVISCDAHFNYLSTNTGASNSFYFNPAANPVGATYSWNFGDGGTSTMRTPTHVYNAVGVYFACLTVTVPGANGAIACTSSWCDSIHVNSTPSGCWAMFTFNVNNYLSNASFHPATTAMGTMYAWDFGDGTTSAQMAPTHHFAHSGVYWVCLTTTRTYSNGSICTDTHCDSVHIMPPPAPVCNSHFQFLRMMTGPRTFRFYALNQSPGTSYFWSFGDGDTSTLGSPIHTYADTGAYQVCLIVTSTNSAGTCTDTTCRNLMVYPMLHATTSGCYANFAFQMVTSMPSTAAFYMNTPGSTYTGILWTFGDSTSSTVTNPVHHFPGPGVYNVCLSVFDSIGHCQSRTCRQLFIGPEFISVQPGDELNDRSADAHSSELTATVYPNPADDHAKLLLSGAAGDAMVMIYDATGRVVYTASHQTNITIEIPVQQLGQGIYFYRVSDGSGAMVSGRLLVK